MVRLPQTSMPLPCQTPVIVAKLMTAIQGLWYQLPVPDKGIFRGVSTRMNARVQHRNSLQKVISCLLVFCLAFYYVGVPTSAYATTADEGVETVAADETDKIIAADETDSPEQLSHFEDQNETASSGQQSHPSEAADSADTTDTTEDEGDRDLNTPDPDDPAANEEPNPQHAVNVSSAFDVDSRTITYTVTVTNTGDVDLTGVSFHTTPGSEADAGTVSSTHTTVRAIRPSRSQIFPPISTWPWVRLLASPLLTSSSSSLRMARP